MSLRIQNFFSDIRYYSKVVSLNWFDYFLLVFWKSLLERFIAFETLENPLLLFSKLVNLYVEGLDDTVTLWHCDTLHVTERLTKHYWEQTLCYATQAATPVSYIVYHEGRSNGIRWSPPANLICLWVTNELVRIDKDGWRMNLSIY